MSLVVDLAKQSYDFGLYLTCLSLWNATFELPFGLARAGAAATRTIVDAGDSKGTRKYILTNVCMAFVLENCRRLCRRHFGVIRKCLTIIKAWRVHTAGAAKATAAMVKLGLLNLVRDIVVVLSQHDRSDVVSQVTPKLVFTLHGLPMLTMAVLSALISSTIVCLTVCAQHDMHVLQITIGLLGEGEFNVVSKINNALITAGYTKEATAVGGMCSALTAQALDPLLSLATCPS